jgi:hypothetical protein
MSNKHTETCGACEAPATKTKARKIHAHLTERVHACDAHAGYMDGWLSDMAAENASENAAAGRFEREYD